jgi:hypothetical protein
VNCVRHFDRPAYNGTYTLIVSDHIQLLHYKVAELHLGARVQIPASRLADEASVVRYRHVNEGPRDELCHDCRETQVDEKAIVCTLLPFKNGGKSLAR